MESWYIENRPTFNSGFENEEFNNYVFDGFDEILEETPLGKDIILCKGAYNENTNTFETEYQTKGVIQGCSPDTQTKGWERQLLTRLNTISDYKYVKAMGKLWLIMTMPTNNSMYEKVVLYMCNYIAKWQNKNGDIIFQPFFVSNASQYNSGEEESKTVTVGYNQLLIYTSLDANTVVLNRNNRMFLDYNKANPIPYRITRIDTVSFSYGESRVCSLILTEDQYNPDTDNKELMLCDYQSSIPSPITTGLKITYVGNPQIRSGGNYKTFTVVTYGNVVWNLIGTEEQKRFITIDHDEINRQSCKIKCLQNDNLIGTSFTLKVTDSSANIGTLVINIVGGV